MFGDRAKFDLTAARVERKDATWQPGTGTKTEPILTSILPECIRVTLGASSRGKAGPMTSNWVYCGTSWLHVTIRNLG